MSRSWSSLVLVFALPATLAGCDPRPKPACVELEVRGCDACVQELTRCEFDGLEATEPSCNDCEAMWGVLDLLCEAGSEVTTDAFLDGLACEPVETIASGG